MSKTSRILDYLDHILSAIDRIGRYTADMDQAGFLSSELVQDAVIRNIEIIGEASNSLQRVAPEYAAQHDHIPWPVMYAMRNRVAHGYDKVDMDMVWRTIQSDLPDLHARISALRALLI